MTTIFIEGEFINPETSGAERDQALSLRISCVRWGLSTSSRTAVLAEVAHRIRTSSPLRRR